MYPIVTTPGLVIDSRPKGEAGKVLSIFTRDLGLIKVGAEGIRLEKSKLRYYTQDFSMATFSVVRGKEYWRLVNAGDMNPVLSTRSPFYDRLAASLAKFLKRFLHGEESHRELFVIVHDALRFVGTDNNLADRDHLDILESITVYRILHSLGYISMDDKVGEKLSGTSVTTDLITGIADLRKTMNIHINRAIKESQL